MAQRAPWNEAPIIAPAGVESPAATPAAAPGTIVRNGMRLTPISGPDPKKGFEITQEQYQAAAAPDQARITAANAAKAESEVANLEDERQRARDQQRFAQAQDLRKGYDAAIPVKAYREQIAAYGDALKTAPTPQGDLFLLYRAVKVLDPLGSVRGEDVENIQNTSPAVQKILAKYQKELNEKGLFSETTRNNLRQELARSMAMSNQALISERARYKGIAEREQLNPLDVIGEHPGIPFQDEEASFLGRPVNQMDAQGNVIAAPANAPRPEGDIGFSGRTVNSEVVPIDQRAQQGWSNFLGGFRKGQLTPEVALTAWENITGRPADPTQMEKVVAHFNATGEWSPDIVYRDPADISDVRPEEGSGQQSLDAGMRGVADTLTVGLAPRLAAGINTLTGDDTYRDNLARERAIDEFDQQNNFAERTIGQVAGGFMIPTGAAAAARGAATGVIRNGGTRAEALAAGRAAATARITREGAAYGASYGAASSDGDLVSLESVVDGAIGLAAGAAGGQVVGRAAGAVGARGEAGREVQRVAQRLDVPSTPATRGGDVAFASQMALGNLPGSSGVVRSGIEAENEGLANAARRVADRLGPVRSQAEAGAAINRGAAAFDRLTSRQGRVLYERRDQLMGGPNTSVPMNEAQIALNEFAGLYPSSQLLQDILIHPAVRRIAGVLDETAQPGAGVGPRQPALTLGETTEALSHVRAALRNAQARSISTGAEERRLNQFEQAIERDLLAAAAQADAAAGRTGTDTAQAAQRAADRFWAQKRTVTDRALKTASKSNRDDIGTSAETVYRNMAADLKARGGNIERLRTAWQSLPAVSRRTFAATMFDDLGRASPGAQNADQTEWSFNTFLTNWNKLDIPARRMVFGGQGVDREIADIANYASRLRDLNKSRNFSNTAIAGFAGAYMLGVGQPLLAGDVGEASRNAAALPLAAVAGAAFMRNPGGRRWLRDVLGALVRRDESHLARMTRRLGVVARQEPAIAADALDLQEWILEQVGDSKPATKPAKP